MEIHSKYTSIAARALRRLRFLIVALNGPGGTISSENDPQLSIFPIRAQVPLVDGGEHCKDNEPLGEFPEKLAWASEPQILRSMRYRVNLSDILTCSNIL